MSARPHFDDLNRRYVETDWVSEYQRLWAMFNHWLTAHVGLTKDRDCIEALKGLPELKAWTQRLIQESSIKSPHRVTDGFTGSHPRFTSNNVISILFREAQNSPIVEPRINYPWRAGTESRVRVSNAIAISQDMFISAYRAHAEMLEQFMTFDMTLHQTIEVIGVYSTGCLFYRSDPVDPSTLPSEAKAAANRMVEIFRTRAELGQLVSLIDSSTVTEVDSDVVELLYNIRNVAMHGSLDFLIEGDNSAARAACDAIDSLIRDIRDNW